MADDLRESWFGARPHARSRRATFALGAVVGGLGGAAAILVAGLVATRGASAFVVASAIVARMSASPYVGVAIAGAAGALLGGVFAILMRHAPRFVARAAFASIFGAALWFCLHVELATHHRPTLPLVPMLVGMCVHGTFVACVPAARR